MKVTWMPLTQYGETFYLSSFHRLPRAENRTGFATSSPACGGASVMKSGGHVRPS